MFQPFYRALGNEADGSGLGLPIVLEIAQQHHASVSLEEAHPGQTPAGARFIVRFTALASSGETAERATPSSGQGSSTPPGTTASSSDNCACSTEFKAGKRKA